MEDVQRRPFSGGRSAEDIHNLDVTMASEAQILERINQALESERAARVSTVSIKLPPSGQIKQNSGLLKQKLSSISKVSL